MRRSTAIPLQAARYELCGGKSDRIAPFKLSTESAKESTCILKTVPFHVLSRPCYRAFRPSRSTVAGPVHPGRTRSGTAPDRDRSHGRRIPWEVENPANGRPKLASRLVRAISATSTSELISIRLLLAGRI